MLGICGSGSFVISAAKIDPRMKAIATVSMYDMGAANRDALNQSQTVEQRKADHRGGGAAALRRSSQAARRSTPAGRCISSMRTRIPSSASSTTSTAPPRGEFTPAGSSPRADDASDADQQREVHELLPVQRHRDDLAAADAVHRGRPGALEGIQRRGLQAGWPAQGARTGWRARATWISTTASTSSPSTS